MARRVLLDDAMTGYDIDPAERSTAVTANDGIMEKGSVELQHFMSRSLTVDVGSPVQFMLKHLKLAVANVGSLLCRL